MSKSSSLYAIYKYDFHAAAGAEDVGEKHVGNAQKCFASLFDQNTIDNLVKIKNKDEAIRLPNDVLGKEDGVFVWRVNNSQIKKLVTRSGKDGNGIDTYEEQEVESNPYCNVLIDNRPGICLMAIEKSTAWAGKPDVLRDVLLENLNRTLKDKFGLEMRIEARMNPRDVWDFVHERIYEHGDFIRKVSFAFQNPKKINMTEDMKVNSERLKAILKIAEISDALKAYFTMEFDRDTNGNISKENKDMAEMVQLCSSNGYDINITFKDFKVYRVGDYVRASYQMDSRVLQIASDGSLTIDGEKWERLKEWLDLVDKETKGYVNESEVPTRRNKARK